MAPAQIADCAALRLLCTPVAAATAAPAPVPAALAGARSQLPPLGRGGHARQQPATARHPPAQRGGGGEGDGLALQVSGTSPGEVQVCAAACAVEEAGQEEYGRGGSVPAKT